MKFVYVFSLDELEISCQYCKVCLRIFVGLTVNPYNAGDVTITFLKNLARGLSGMKIMPQQNLTEGSGDGNVQL